MDTDLSSVLAADRRPVAGVEHEYRVSRQDVPADFRAVVDTLGVAERLDPGDPHAHRGTWGGVITADGREAEVATPPVPIEPGFADVLCTWAARGRELVLDADATLTLDGYSTHLSVEVDDATVCRVAGLFTSRFAPAMMLMLDRGHSPGLLVRPRRGRLELCGEFVDGDALVAALVFAAGASRACAAGATDRRARRLLPPAVRLRPERAVERFGTYVDRRAFGTDLYAHGRRARLRTRRSSMTAQTQLEAAWAAARDHVLGHTTPAELALVDAVVTGRRPIPLEAAAAMPPVRRQRATAMDDASCVYLGLVSSRARPTFAVDVHAATWDVTVFRVSHEGSQLFVTIPRPYLAGFVHSLDAGRLDRMLDEALRRHEGEVARVA